MKNKIKSLSLAIAMSAVSSLHAAPPVPAVTVTVEGNTVTAFWNPVIGATGYNLYAAPTPSYSPISKIPMGTETDITITLPVGDAWAVAVTSEDASGESNYSNIETFTVKSADPADANATRAQIISGTAYNVILATYEELASRAAILEEATAALQFNSTDANLLAAQNAWRDARNPWEQSEGFLFGPVDTQGLDPALDSWPVNRTDLDAVLSSGNTLTVDFVGALDDTLHGFHTIEYLLFGAANDKQASELTAREKEYLASSTTLFKNHAEALASAWRASGDNYVNNFATAGQTGSSFVSEEAALQELVNGMIGIVDEVGNGKIADPFSQTNTELVESQFSYNSLLDFENNIRSVENVYLGRYLQQDGPGLSDLVKRNDAALDTEIRTGITNSINAIQAIPFPFRDSISTTEGRALIEAAQVELTNLQTTLETKLLPNVVNFQ